jgi:hypothetical protein
MIAKKLLTVTTTHVPALTKKAPIYVPIMKQFGTSLPSVLFNTFLHTGMGYILVKKK